MQRHEHGRGFHSFGAPADETEWRRFVQLRRQLLAHEAPAHGAAHATNGAFHEHEMMHHFSHRPFSRIGLAFGHLLIDAVDDGAKLLMRFSELFDEFGIGH